MLTTCRHVILNSPLSFIHLCIYKMAPGTSGRDIELKAYDEAVHRAIERYLERPIDALPLWSRSVHTLLRDYCAKRGLHASKSLTCKPCI